METVLGEKAVRGDFLMTLWPEEAALIHLMRFIWPFEAWNSNIPVDSSLVILPKSKFEAIRVYSCVFRFRHIAPPVCHIELA